MNAPEIFAVVADIKDAYKDVEAPNFAFVEKAVKRQVHAHLLSRLQQSFEIRETTDSNDDVAFAYLLTRESQDLGLWLSMVGPYALVQRVGGSQVEAVQKPYSAPESAVLDTLSAFHVMTVPEDLLRYRIRMNLPDAKNGKVTLYQALFDNSQALPWSQQEWTDELHDEQPD